MAQLNHEPSMEDILASIKRIIAEDSEAAAPRAARPIRREMAPVQTERAEAVADADFEPVPSEIETVSEAAAMPEPEATPEIAADQNADAGDVLELTSPIAEDVAPQPQAAAKPARVKQAPPKIVQPDMPQPESIQPAREPVTMDRLMSDNAAHASRNAFAALTQLQVRAEAGQENTLEGLVADLLRPMLREWLDRELPAMVERMVSAEIGRLSGRG